MKITLPFVASSATASATVLVTVFATMFGIGAFADMQLKPTPGKLEIAALSTDPARVTGGDVLIRILVPNGQATAPKVAVDGRDVSSVFKPAAATANSWIGLVTGLVRGRNTIEADGGSAGRASLTVTNYPLTGPVFSGPWMQPYICQTDAFALPDGSKLGPPLDADCSARTVVQYVYRSKTPPGDARQPFTPLPNPSVVPPDVVKTTTASGQTVNFIVRVETGTMNRGIYQNAVLHDPTVDAPVSPTAPPHGWNRRLVAMHGSGCPSGWYIQGAAEGVSILDLDRLGRGDALFINTLNHPTNSCNAVLAGETTMMGKEHFIETFGVPAYTLSVGGSGGAYTSLQVADAYPGLIDAVDIRATFPDALAIAMSGLDAHLLTHYFAGAGGAVFSDAQKIAVSGYQGMQAFVDAANQSQRTDPVPGRSDIEGYQSARWNAAVPEALRYDPAKNPQGARPTVFDAARNIYGINPQTGAALRPFDNVGVQYGLNALNAGTITIAQFLALNEQIGGYDDDANYVRPRAVGDANAIKRAYQSGLMLGANGGLMSIPIMDNATSTEERGYHYGWFHYALRERVRQANGGHSDNMVMWRSVAGTTAQTVLDRWATAYKADVSTDAPRAKVLRARPAEAVDGCYDKAKPPQFIAEDLVFTREPTSRCSELYPVYSNPRKEAGGPLAANVLKCQLKPIDPKDYRGTFSDAEHARLAAIFSAGVCDWSKPGVNQVPVVPWASFGPAPENQVFAVNPTRTSSR
jgi:hypothetical protein